uniref:Membrane-associated kinase regulator 1 n=1 Tax=Noccaea caerulescens TaxID=107243 RepID=A0A1J3HSV7_NOCCA
MEKTRNSDEPPEFEFGSLSPSCPSQDSFTENSPADHLFFNGRLLPHAFPAASNNPKLSVSRTTSEYTSRSNSTNSRSSICSSSSSTSYSPRMSSFNGNNNNNNSPLDRKPLDLSPPISMCGKTVNKPRMKATEMVTASLYRSYSSQRWQYITPAPVKRSRGIRVGGRKKKTARMKKMSEERGGSRVMNWWRRILMAAIFACRECHALEGA